MPFHRWHVHRARGMAIREEPGMAAALGLVPAAFLADNNSTGFFAALKDLLLTGPTYTNVNDFRAIVVDRL